ncbi:MAG: hypothetical protein O7G85_01480 [Planctomycetota bacterium]|nr:hypothetical protein [Planctomycetota bacterium]
MQVQIDSAHSKNDFAAMSVRKDATVFDTDHKIATVDMAVAFDVIQTTLCRIGLRDCRLSGRMQSCSVASAANREESEEVTIQSKTRHSDKNSKQNKGSASVPGVPLSPKVSRSSSRERQTTEETSTEGTTIHPVSYEFSSGDSPQWHFKPRLNACFLVGVHTLELNISVNNDSDAACGQFTIDISRHLHAAKLDNTPLPLLAQWAIRTQIQKKYMTHVLKTLFQVDMHDAPSNRLPLENPNAASRQRPSR